VTQIRDPSNYAQRIAAALDKALGRVALVQNCRLIAKVGMRRQDSLLYVALEISPAEGLSAAQQGLENAHSLVALVRQSLLQVKTDLALSWVKLVKVSARLSGEAIPLWQEDLLLLAAPPIAKTLMRPAMQPKGMGDVNVHIGGNLSGQMIIGNDNQLHHYSYHVAHGGVLNVAAAPTIWPRATPLAIKPKPIARFLNRQTVLPLVQQTLTQKLPLELYAESGFGKTALMQHIAHDAHITDGFADGIVYLPVSKQPAADLLQSLYDEFYEASVPFKPSYAQVQHALAEKQALVILNGLNLEKEAGEWLLSALPNCTFVLVSRLRIYWQDGGAIALKGLPLPESIALLQIELGRALSEAEQGAAKSLWTALSGNPLQLRRAAAQVTDNYALADLVQAIKAESGQISGKSLFQQGATRLNANQQKLLALMGAMGTVALSAEQSQAISQVPQTAEVLQTLAQLHWVNVTDTGSYQLSSDLAEVVSKSYNPQPWLAKATDYFTAKGTPVAQADSSEAMMHLLSWTQQTGQWQQSLALARRLDPLLALNGQWQQWQQVLTHSLQAAELLGDAPAAAWSRHQLGTRSLALGETALAESLLARALRLREELGDQAGAAVTRHNLGLIVPPLIGSGGMVFSRSANGPLRWLTRWPGVIGLGVTGALVAGLAFFWPSAQQPAKGQLSVSEKAIAFGPREVRSASEPRGVTLTNKGTTALQLLTVSLVGETDFKLAPAGDCKANVILQPGQTCELLAVFAPVEAGKHTAEVTVEAGPQASPETGPQVSIEAGKSGAVQKHSIELSGQGHQEQLPGLSFDTSALIFGKIPLTELTQKTFTITNDGTAPLILSAFDIVGDQATEYDVSAENCTAKALAPNQSCSGELWFEPDREGDRNATLIVKSNLSSPSELPLFGVGITQTSSPRSPAPLIETRPTVISPPPASDPPTRVPPPEPDPASEPPTEPDPTIDPTIEPTMEPTIEPTIEPTLEPYPTIEPTIEPTLEPYPTIEPTVEPTIKPYPTLEPTIEPYPTESPIR
jgi:hypothetical protein